MKRRFFGYVVVCEGCCVDLKYDQDGKDWESCSEKVTASAPIYSSAKEATEAGLKVSVRKQAGAKACFNKNGKSWTGVDLENWAPNKHRVFTYEMK